MHTRVLAVLLASSIGWGLAGVGVRAAFMEGASTETVVVGRVAVATLAVAAFVVAARRRPTRKAWLHGALIGIPRIGLAPLFFVASLNYISAGVEGLFITLIPATTAALGSLFLREHLRPLQITGLAIGLAGTTLIIVSGESGLTEGGNVLLGGALALAAVLAGSTSGVLARRFAPHHGTAALALPMFVWGSVVIAVAVSVMGGPDFGSVSSSVWVLLIALGLGGTLLPFAGTLYASRHTTAARVALTGYLAPLIGVTAGALLLGEEITFVIAVGGMLTLVGIALAGRRRRRVEPRPAEH